MTKTFTTIAKHRFLNPVEHLVGPLGTLLDGSFVWNFEFGSLEIIWDLFIGAWNFHKFGYAG